MNYIDLVLLLALLVSVLAGIRSGFIRSILELITWLSSLVIAFITYPCLSNILLDKFPSLGMWSPLLSFIIIAVLSRIILNLLAGSVLRGLPREAHTNTFNRFLGIIPGAINGLIFAAVLATVLLLVPISDSISAESNNSRLTSRLVMEVEKLEEKLSPIIEEPLAQLTPKITGKVHKDEMIKLPYRVKKFEPRPDLEARMLQLVNKERESRGLKALKPDTALTAVARGYSVKMFAEGFFSHVSPEGSTLESRLEERKVRYLVAGENLALSQTLSMAHTGLMNSPGHRANILNPRYGRLGIGVIDGGIYGLMVTQNFRN